MPDKLRSGGKGRTHGYHRMPDDVARQAADVFTKHLGKFLPAATELGISRDTLRNRLDAAIDRGFLKPQARAETNKSRWRPFEEIRTARLAEFERVKAAGDGRTIRDVHMVDDGPFGVVAMGDPHLDNPGTDLLDWERWHKVLSAKKRVYGIALGDWLDAWPRVLGFLYGTAETTAPEAWILLDTYLKRHGPDYVASVSGNHDDWAGYTDLLGKLMADQRILHRHKALRVGFVGPSGRRVTFGLRHRYPGNSIWNPAHAVMKMAQMGWRDNALIGGDKHVSNDGFVRDPNTGLITHCFQVASFKKHDDYADDLGLMDKHVSPAVFLAVDPSRGDDEHSLITRFYDPEEGADYLSSLRKRRGF